MHTLFGEKIVVLKKVCACVCTRLRLEGTSGANLGTGQWLSTQQSLLVVKKRNCC